ncbi:MAG: PIN domain-containing protein [Chloroflexi bacterium]|nr:PIN domain-containing protein [Chloroflexota bacterium]
MGRSEILADSSYLFAFFDATNSKHAAAVVVADLYGEQFVVSDVALTEVAFLFNREGGIPAVLQFIDRLTVMQPQLERVSIADLTRAREIMATYSDAKLDFVDCCMMAHSERLNITRVCTFDRRDFSIFRPTHCDYLELLP